MKVVHQVLKQITLKGHVRDSQTSEKLHPNPVLELEQNKWYLVACLCQNTQASKGET